MGSEESIRSKVEFDIAIEAIIQNDYRCAYRYLERAASLDPNSPEIRTWLGDVLRHLRELSKAIDILTEAIALSPGWHVPYYCRSLCYEELGDHRHAESDRQIAFRKSDRPYLEIPGRFRPLLLTPPFLEAARDAQIPVDAVLLRVGALAETEFITYPDGTVQISGEMAYTVVRGDIVAPLEVYEMTRAHAEDPAQMRLRLGGASYVSISPFPPRLYSLLLWGESMKQVEGNHIRVMTGRIPEVGKPFIFADLTDIPVFVAYKRRFTKASREQFSKELARYFATTADPEHFGEGPVKPVSRSVEFFSRVARFTVDAHRSGPNAINWLILSLIDAIPGNLPTEIYFTDQPSHAPAFVRSFDELYDMKRSQHASIDVPGSKAIERRRARPQDRWRQFRIVADDSQSTANCANELHTDTWHGFGSIQSPYFEVVLEDRLSSGSVVIEIHLAESPTPGYRDPFGDSVRHWLNVGTLGAFGGGGFDSYTEMRIDESHCQATFRCDMGSADWQVALRALVGILETWHVHGIGIDKVVIRS